jgi:hypothetical protein
MNTPSWMLDQTHRATRAWTKRSRGRRSSDRRLNLEAVLAVGVVLAWAWGAYELTLLFLR